MGNKGIYPAKSFSDATNADLRQSAVYNLGKEAQRKYEIQRTNHLVSKITLVKLNASALEQGSLLINHGAKNVLAKQTTYERRSSNDFSWFGRLEDETGIFFYRDGQSGCFKVLYWNHPYTLLPLEGDVHMLIEYGPNNLGSCLLYDPPVKSSRLKPSTRVVLNLPHWQRRCQMITIVI
ncbi:hypothetical protein [Paraflavitalea speifideaquila]|uniref:hypothetical protein n=1 Tax=Paraflavitalea speifideaquila TaxID=3076558 RepID=UPI0028E6BBF8|nr:hypothetical protein [Paraflavitalea speifideiaquila]